MDMFRDISLWLFIVGAVRRVLHPLGIEGGEGKSKPGLRKRHRISTKCFRDNLSHLEVVTYW